jgi:ABC-type branched-subunit amino acid transport system substrate-binding protein
MALTKSFTSCWVVCAAESHVYKIGVLLPPEEPQALSVREGILLAEAQVNKTGGTNARVIIRGRTGQWGADGVEAARMVTDDGVDGLIAPPDGAASHLTLQVSGRTAVPVMCLCPDSSVGRTGVPWMLRVVPRTEDEAEALFQGINASNSPGATRWTAIVPDARAGRELSQDLSQAANRSGKRFQQILQLNTTNAALIQQRALAGNPDVILLCLPALAAGNTARNLRTAGYSGVLAGPGRLSSAEFIAAAGDAFEGFIIPAIARTDAGQTRWNSFRSSYEELWHHPPDTTAAMSYDAASLLLYLLQQPPFQAPPHSLTPEFSWPGVTGDLTFDSNGNRKVKLDLLRGHRQSFIALN